jgi:hypothetical protein
VKNRFQSFPFKCNLQRYSEADFSTCPMCRAALPSGLTPEHVREKRAAQAVVNAANAQQNAIIGAAARAREAVRAQYVRRMVNRPAPPALPPPIREEDGGSAGSGGSGGGGFGVAPPSPARSVGPTSAPATPARGVPVMRGGGGGGGLGSAATTPTAPSSHAARASSSSSTFASPFITAAEELRARAEASAVAVAAVGLYKLNHKLELSLTHSLKAPSFNPCTLNVISWFQKSLLFQIQLVPLHCGVQYG